MSGSWTLEQRRLNAKNSFINCVQERFKKNKEEAEKIFTVYLKYKIVSLDPASGQFNLKHGAFWETEPINNALKM